MKRTLMLVIAVLLGGLAGALIMWQMTTPTNVYIDVHAAPEKAERLVPADSDLPEPESKRLKKQTPATTQEVVDLRAEESPAETVDAGPPRIVPAVPPKEVRPVMTNILTSLTSNAAPAVRRGASGGIDDALTYAMEAADPYTKEGYIMREDYWGGDLPVKEKKPIVHQLFKGNEYWFWMGTDSNHAKVSIHVYDEMGNLTEVESWQKPYKAAAKVIPKKTGPHYLMVEIERSPEPRTYWALAYGFK